MTDGINAAADEQVLPAIGGEGNEPEGITGEIEAETDGQDVGEPEGEAGEGEDTEGNKSEADELEDYEVDGKSYKIPKALKPMLMMNADYTRKTQETAELRKTYEAKIQEAESAYAVSQEVLEKRAHLMNIDAQLQQYQGVNWQQLEQEDPVAAMSHWRNFQMLKDTRSEVAQNLDKVQNDRSEKAKQETANRLRQTVEYAQKEIPGWTPEIDAKITEFATTGLGFNREQLTSALDPQIYKTLHLAWIGQQTLQKQNAAAPRQPTPQKPLSTVTPKASPSARKSAAEMSVDEMAAFLNKR
jgi:hypothetical protein